MELERILSIGVIAVPGYFLVLAIIEAAVLSRFEKYDWKSFGASSASLILHNVFLNIVPFSITAPLAKYLAAHSLLKICFNGSTWAALGWAFLLHEFCWYWYHRATHRIRWFWVGHSVHHSPNDLTFASYCRATLTHKLTGVQLFFLPMLWIGFPPSALLLTTLLGLTYEIWIHATWIPKLGWLEYVFNTPSAHRVHHAANVEYLDSNYGQVLVIFDRIFGTYVEEREDNPCRYGLVQPQTSYNPIRFELDPWLALAADLFSSRSLREFFGYLFLPPGWKANGEGETTQSLRRRAAAQRSSRASHSH
jgi:sterol desaturase/sphingolipid hydroxylase (fatty acid hydroxylase superfamily)